MKLTTEQKEANKAARKAAREAAKESARIETEKSQRPVKSLKLTIEWKRSRMWGNNPRLEAEVWYMDGSFSRFGPYTCSGCGYDKESTVIAAAFNAHLRYKLWQLDPAEANHGSGSTGNLPYGISMYNDGKHRHYSGGVGTSCYYQIGEAIGGKFERIASGKTFDVYEWTELGLPVGQSTKKRNEFAGLGAIMAMGALLTDTKAEANDFRARILAATPGISLPEDWETLTDEEKETRLNKVMAVMNE